MKRFYSVKEASKLIGVSTNTIYKYIEEGKLTYRRIGKGRIKISYKSIAPFIQDENIIEETIKDDYQETNLHNQRIISKAKNLKVDLSNVIISFKNDIIFFRLFKGIIFIGLGIIYFFTTYDVFAYNGFFPQELTRILTGLLPLILFLSGWFNLAEALNPQKFSKYHLKLDIISSFVFSYLAFIALLSGKFIRFSFAIAFVAVSIEHILKGVNGQNQHNFYNSFIRFTLCFLVCIGVIIPLNPQLLLIPALTSFVEANKGLFAIFWFLLIVAPTVYFASPYRKESIFITIQLILLSIFGFGIGSYITLSQEWDLTYLCFISGLFALFLAWWSISKLKITASKIYIVCLSFLWISTSLLIGLFALKTSSDQVQRQARETASESLDVIIGNVNSIFDNQRAILLSFAGDKDVITSIEEGNTENLTAEAKEIYDKTPNLYRVLIFNKNGTALGVYPRSGLTTGTNFSSRDYFQKTITSYKGYISPSFESILGEYTIIQTEPVFKNNLPVGMIGIGINLVSLSGELQNQLGLLYELSAYDENGIYILSNDSAKIGEKYEGTINENNKSTIVTNQAASYPRWNMQIKAPVYDVIPKISDANIILSILFLANSLVSLAVGIAISLKKDPNDLKNVRKISPFSIPQFT